MRKEGALSLSPKTSRGQVTMNRIIRAAEIEFSKKGYYNAGINDIAARAKVASGTIYLYFKDKYSLYVHLLTSYGERVRKSVAQSIQGSASREEMERLGLLSFLQMVRKNPQIYKIIWESLYINPELFADYYETFALRYKHQLEHSPQDITPMDFTVLSYALMGVANFIGLKYVFFDKQADLEQVVDEVMKFYRHGLFGGGLHTDNAEG